MKRISVLFVAITLLMGIGVAKAQKLASIDYEAVLATMPEAKQMQTELDAFTKAKGDELNKQVGAFQTDLDAYQKAAAGLTAAQREAKEGELQKQQQKLQELQALAQQDLAKKRDGMLKPIIDKLNASVAKVSKAAGYEFVVDASALIYKAGPDVTDAVKKDLGIK